MLCSAELLFAGIGDLASSVRPSRSSWHELEVCPLLSIAAYCRTASAVRNKIVPSLVAHSAETVVRYKNSVVFNDSSFEGVVEPPQPDALIEGVLAF